MKKCLFVLGMLAVVIALMLCIKPILKWSSNSLGNLIVMQFEKEEKERRQKIENDEIVRGKDTILIWENMYEIGHYFDGNHLDICTDGLTTDNILEKITKHKVIKKKLYIISDEGFAVIDKDNLCRVFVMVPSDEFVNGYSVDEQGNKVYYSRYIENEHIQYLSEFNDFSVEEQGIFNKLIGKLK